MVNASPIGILAGQNVNLVCAVGGAFRGFCGPVLGRMLGYGKPQTI